MDCNLMVMATPDDGVPRGWFQKNCLCPACFKYCWPNVWRVFLSTSDWGGWLLKSGFYIQALEFFVTTESRPHIYLQLCSCKFCNLPVVYFVCRVHWKSFNISGGKCEKSITVTEKICFTRKQNVVVRDSLFIVLL